MSFKENKKNKTEHVLSLKPSLSLALQERISFMCSSVKTLGDINKVFVIPNLFRNLFDCGFNVSMLLVKMLNQVQHDSLRNNLPLFLRRKGQTAPIGEDVLRTEGKIHSCPKRGISQTAPIGEVPEGQLLIISLPYRGGLGWGY